MKINSFYLRKTIGAGLLAAFASSAFAAGAFIGGADDSQSRFGGDGYAYFHENTPGSSKSVTPFRGKYIKASSISRAGLSFAPFGMSILPEWSSLPGPWLR